MQSSAENDDRVITLAREVLLMPAAKREEFLRMKCKDQADLYSQVAEVVEWEERMGGFLSEPLIKYIDLEEDSPAEEVFQPGDTISERFHIMREVGRGGMGTVYEAFDRKRNKRIAIKRAQPGFGPLLTPELEGALKVRHPNICLVNEIHTATTEHGELDFLTMEYLEGETLAARLKRDGKLPAHETLPIARQLCAGVAAAHAAGVLHRDLKPANIILTNNDDGTIRAVITDFGLASEARLNSELEGGTPLYMAPELLNREKPSKASDVYALGVILYQVVTGKAPSPAQNAERLAPTTMPREFSQQVDCRWDEAILKCLNASPRMRPSAGQVLAIFDQRPLWKSPALAMAVLAIVALLAALQQPIRNYFKPADVRLAILPVDAPPELQELGNGILQDVADRVKATNARNATLVVIPTSESARNQISSPEAARQVLHATHALQVRLKRDHDVLIADEALIELSTQTHVGDLSASYTELTQPSLPSALAGVVTSGLRLQHTSKHVLNDQATVPYDRGLYFLTRDEASFDSAIPLFQQAMQLDPSSPLPRAKLVEAFLEKFWATNDPRWMHQAESAFSEAAAIDPDYVPVLIAGGRLQASKNRPLKALSYFNRVQELEPRNVEVRLRIAALYNQQDMLEDAKRSYLEAIAQDPAYYGTYEEFGRFYYAHGEYSLAAEEFRNAVSRAPGLYDVYTYLGGALNEMGKDQEAENVLLASLKIRETSRALISLGAIKAYLGQDMEAVKFYERALQLNPSNFICLLNLGDSSRRLGRSDDAGKAYSRGLAIVMSQLSENPSSGITRAYLASLQAHLGNKIRALDEIRQALRLAPSDTLVQRRAVLTYVALGETQLALEQLEKMPEEAVRELNRHPDMAELRHDPRFIALAGKTQRGG